MVEYSTAYREVLGSNPVATYLFFVSQKRSAYVLIKITKVHSSVVLHSTAYREVRGSNPDATYLFFCITKRSAYVLIKSKRCIAQW